MDLSLPLLSSMGNQPGSEIQDEILRSFHDNRVLIINDEISDWLLEEVILHIFYWNLQDKDIPVEKRKPITIIIDSEGGSVFTANNLVDVIRSSKTPVVSLGGSMVASAAFSVYIACHKRYSFKHTSFLMHESSRQLANSTGKMRDWMDFLDELDEVDKQLVLERTNFTNEEYEERKRDEVLFFADEAVRRGIVDGIIGVDVDLDEIL